MNAIIRLILDIFQALFEQDAERRRQERQQRRPEPKPSSKPASKGKARDLDAWIEDLLDDERPAGGTSPPASQPVSTPRYAPIPQHYETTEEHLERLERERSRTAKAHARKMHLVEQKQEAVEPGHFILPGDSPVQQMVIAQVILGPPRGRGRR